MGLLDGAGFVFVCMARLARLGADGVPLPGARNLLVTDAIELVRWSPEIEAGEEITNKNGCGAVCVSVTADDVIKRYNLELQFCRPDPEVDNFLINAPVYYDGDDAIGGQAPALGAAISGNGVSLEVWAKAYVGSDQSTDYPYAWFTFPLTKWTPGQRSAAAEAQVAPFTGRATENPNWYDGPANDWAYDSSRAINWVRTDQIPAVTDGAVALAAS